MSIDTFKAAMIGCGLVGSTTVFSLIQKGLFSEIVMIDSDKERAIGESMDLIHGTAFIGQTDIHAGSYDELKDTDVIMISAGSNSRDDEDRLSLASRNIPIIERIIDDIMATGFSGVILVISNPVDVLTYIAWSRSGLSEKQVIGSGTVLDSARLKSIIAGKLGVDSRSAHAYILGEHGDSEFVSWSRANVAGIPLPDFCNLDSDGPCGFCDYENETAEILREVRDSAYQIINRKKATYYGIAMAVSRICEAITRNEKSILPVSGVMTGDYGISNVALSMPCILGSNGIEHRVPYPMTGYELDQLHKSAEVIRGTLEQWGY